MATCYNRYTRQYYTCRSRWSNWGRWVALVVILLAVFFLFFIFACISQRRRRKAGTKPFYGTGWTYKLPGGGTAQGQQYNPQYGNQQNYQAPTQYNSNTQAPQGGYYAQEQGGANQSYFGGQRNDPEMQAPQNAYGNQNTGYAPPSGPPPNKVH